MHPISTAINSVISSGKYDAPCPTSSYTDIKIFVLYLGFIFSLFNSSNNPIKADTLPLSSINLDFINPLSVIFVFGSIKIKSPLFIPKAFTSSLFKTLSSILISIFLGSLGLLDASSNTCIDGLVLKKVPVYSLPSLVLTMQYSESKVGTIGPPTKSNFKVPFGVIDLTIAPKVST